MKFLIQEYTNPNFELVYYQEDGHSFDVEPFVGGGFTSIVIDTLQLEIDDEGKILYVWGYCPLIDYKDIATFPKHYKSNSLIAILDKPPIPGVSQSINKKELWPIFINKKEGWVCIGDPKLEGKELIQFAPDCVAALVNQEMKAVWLHPKRGLPS